jgi:hypothetical protein
LIYISKNLINLSLSEIIPCSQRLRWQRHEPHRERLNRLRREGENMPKPRQKDDGGSGAPVLDILSAHVRLEDVAEFEEPYTVTRERDGATFELDPGFNCKVVIISGHDAEGEDCKGATFFEKFKYKLGEDSGEWILKENSKLGRLAKVVHPDYFADAVPDLSEETLEGFEFLCSIVPKKIPDSGKVIGSTIAWESMRRLPAKTTSSAKNRDTVAEEDFSDMPF